MKMKSIIITIIAFILSVNTYGGDHVNNGGGLSEQRITYAYLSMEKYINLCLNIESCMLSNKEENLLKKIKNQLSDEYKNTKQIQFLSEKKNPGLFIIDGEIKVAKTGDDVASPILFNTDLLYSKSGESAISMARATSILIHELGHHNNKMNSLKDEHTFLDLLGNKVALTYSEYKLITPLTSAHRNIQLNVFNQINKKVGYPNILIQVNDKLLDVSKAFEEKLKCTRIILPLGIQILGKKPKGARLHNLHWTKIKEKSNSWNFSVTGNLSNFCQDRTNLLHLIKKFKIVISFKAKKKIINDKVILTLKENSIKIKQIYNPWIKFFDIPII